MRRSPTTYRTLSVLTIAAALALPGCAQPGTALSPASSGPAVPAEPSSASPAATDSPGTSTGAGCAQGWQTQPVILSEQDSGGRVCLQPGTRLEIYLHGTASDRWSAPVCDSAVLGPAVSGKGTLAIGVTAGFFVARQPGPGHVTSTRSAERFELTVLVG
jgi:hypothetical protein